MSGTPREYALVVGSQRPQSQSKKVAGFLVEAMTRHDAVKAVHVMDLACVRLQLWDESSDLSEPGAYPEWFGWERILRRCDAYIVVVPEWDGMAPPAVKNFFQHCSRDIVGHKPCLLVGISSSGGGAVPIAEMRMSSYKNCRICFIPEHLLVRNVESVLNSHDPSGDADSRLRRRIYWVLDVLYRYADALALVRLDAGVFADDYPYGM